LQSFPTLEEQVQHLADHGINDAAQGLLIDSIQVYEWIV
jgi:hypothetical protein